MADIYGYSVQEKKQQIIVSYDLNGQEDTTWECEDWESLAKELDKPDSGIYKDGIDVIFINIGMENYNLVRCGINDFDGTSLTLMLPNGQGYLHLENDPKYKFMADFTAFFGVSLKDRVITLSPSIQGLDDMDVKYSIRGDSIIQPQFNGKGIDCSYDDRIAFMLDNFNTPFHGLDVNFLMITDMETQAVNSYIAKFWVERGSNDNNEFLLIVHLTTSEGDYILKLAPSQDDVL